MIINTNISALNSQRQLNGKQRDTASLMEKLSSGLRINRAGDDAAGLAISEKMKGQIRGLAQAQRNVQDGIALVQTAEGGLNEIHALLQRQRELIVQAANDTLNVQDRQMIQTEINQLNNEIDNIANTTQFNKIYLLNRTDNFTQTTTETSSTTVESVRFVSCDSANYVVKSPTELLAGYRFTFDTSSNANDPLTATINTSTNYINVMWGTNNRPTSISEVNRAIDDSLTARGMDTSVIFETRPGSTFNIDTLQQQQGSFVLAFRGIVEEIEVTNTAEAGEIIELPHVILQVGPNEGHAFEVTLTDARAASLGVTNINVLTGENASSSIQLVDSAISEVSSERSKYGAYQNALEHIYNNINNAEVNLASAQSRIADADMAKIFMEFTKENILSQTAQAMLAQANATPQSVMQLLG